MSKRVILNTADESSLDGQMERLATQMAADLLAGAVVPRPKIEAFAKLTSYFTATRKLTGGEDAPPPTGFSFGAAKARLSKPKAPKETTQ